MTCGPDQQPQAPVGKREAVVWTTAVPAQDDTTVPVSQTTNFAALLKKTNPDVTLDTSARGGHYQSMINAGIPKGIAWMNKQ